MVFKTCPTPIPLFKILLVLFQSSQTLEAKSYVHKTVSHSVNFFKHLAHCTWIKQDRIFWFPMNSIGAQRMGENTLQKTHIPILKYQILQVRWLRVVLGSTLVPVTDVHIRRHSMGGWNLESPRVHLLTESNCFHFSGYWLVNGQLKCYIFLLLTSSVDLRKSWFLY